MSAILVLLGLLNRQHPREERRKADDRLSGASARRLCAGLRICLSRPRRGFIWISVNRRRSAIAIVAWSENGLTKIDLLFSANGVPP